VTIRLGRTPGSSVALGLGLAAIGTILGIFLSGSGEGWNTPLFVSMILWVIFPATLYLIQAQPPQRMLLFALAAIALIADFVLIKGTIAEARVFPLYLQVNRVAGVAIIAAWVALWLLWQLLVVRALMTRPADA
jgi:hypothetical protein